MSRSPVRLALVKGDELARQLSLREQSELYLQGVESPVKELKCPGEGCHGELELWFHSREWLGDESNFVWESVSRRGMGDLESNSKGGEVGAHVGSLTEGGAKGKERRGGHWA